MSLYFFRSGHIPNPNALHLRTGEIVQLFKSEDLSLLPRTHGKGQICLCTFNCNAEKLGTEGVWSLLGIQLA